MVHLNSGSVRRIAPNLILAVALLASRVAFASSETSTITPRKALETLKEGNRRFVASKVAHPRQDLARVRSVAKAQHPFAVILGCSDSRVPPEIAFDQGIGDLFVLRVAGNIVDPVVLGSIEYATEHLGTPLIVVLGHERCGAVTAAVQGGSAPGHIGVLTRAIAPAAAKARRMKGDLVENAVNENVRNVVRQLEADRPILSEKMKKGKLEVIGARYDLDDGTVTFFQ